MSTREEDDALFGINTSSFTPAVQGKTRRMLQYINAQVEAARTIVALSEEWQNGLNTVYPNEATTTGATSTPSKHLTPTVPAEQYNDEQGTTSPEAEITEADFDFVIAPDSAQHDSIDPDVQHYSTADASYSDDDNDIQETPPFCGDLEFNPYLHAEADDGEISGSRSPASTADAFESGVQSPDLFQDGYESDSSTITVRPIVRAATPSSDTSDEGDIEHGPVDYTYRSRTQVAQWMDVQGSKSRSSVLQPSHEPSFATGECPEVSIAEAEMSDVASSTGHTTDDELDRVQTLEDARANEMSDYEDSDMSSDGSVTPTPRSSSNVSAHVTSAQSFEDSEDSVSDAPTPSSSYGGDSEMTDTEDADETGQEEPAPFVFDWNNPSVRTFTRSGNHIDF